MSTPTLIGFPQSSFVWSARAGLTILGVEHSFQPMNPGEHKAPDYVARHPFGKVPLLSVDGVDIFETSAILRWADAVAGGGLFPKDPVAGAEVEQWVSTVQSYLYPWIVPGYFFKHPRDGSAPDPAVIDAVVPKIALGVAALEARIGDGPWIVGDSLTAADILVGPVLFVLSQLPEGKAILAESPKVSALLGALSQHGPFMSCAYRA